MPPGMKLTKIEKAWVLYDVGNSAFILLVSTLFPITAPAVGRAACLAAPVFEPFFMCIQIPFQRQAGAALKTRLKEQMRMQFYQELFAFLQQ